MFEERFKQALRSKHQIKVAFHVPAERQTLVRVCAPLDYGPDKVQHDGANHFHVWAYENVNGAQLLSLDPAQVRRLEILDDEFDPTDFMWFLSRDWGQHL